MIFVATEKVGQQNFFHPSLLLLFLNPRSGIDKNQDPGWDKHPGSAMLDEFYYPVMYRYRADAPTKTLCCDVSQGGAGD